MHIGLNALLRNQDLDQPKSITDLDTKNKLLDEFNEKIQNLSKDNNGLEIEINQIKSSLTAHSMELDLINVSHSD